MEDHPLAGRNDLDDEEGNYLFHPSHLHDPAIELRRWAVIEVSKQQLVEHEQEIIDIVLAPETDQTRKEQLRRHAVRALGSLKSRKGVPALLAVITQENGLIVGDALQSLGKIGAVEHKDLIASFVSSPIGWVSQQARFALKQFDKLPEISG